jgi:hypothetical protein
LYLKIKNKREVLLSYAIKPRANINPAVKDAACGALALSVGIIALALIVALISPFMSAAATGFADLGHMG